MIINLHNNLVHGLQIGWRVFIVLSVITHSRHISVHLFYYNRQCPPKHSYYKSRIYIFQKEVFGNMTIYIRSTQGNILSALEQR